MKKLLKKCSWKVREGNFTPMEVLLHYGTMFIFIMALLLVLAPTIITFTIIPPDTVPRLGSIVQFQGFTIGVLPAIKSGHNLLMVGVCFFLFILWKILVKTRLFCLNVLWNWLQVIFWLVQTMYFIYEGPFLLRAGFCGLLTGAAIYEATDIMKEKKENILKREGGK